MGFYTTENSEGDYESRMRRILTFFREKQIELSSAYVGLARFRTKTNVNLAVKQRLAFLGHVKGPQKGKSATKVLGHCICSCNKKSGR